MPPKSQAQRRWAYAVAEGKVKGVPKSVGVEFEGHGIRGLPAHAPTKAKRGTAAELMEQYIAPKSGRVRRP